MRGEKKVFLAVFTVCLKFVQREIVLSNLNKRLNTEDNLPDDTQMLQSVVFMLQLYCFPLGDHWTVTRDHVRFKGGAGAELKQLTQPPGSQMSWLA